MDPLGSFLVRAALAGVGVALAAAPLGCVVAWRRMAFFGDATAHAAILGVAGALTLAVAPVWGALLAALAMGAGVAWLSERGWAADTALAVLSHGALAVGLVAISLVGVRVDPEAVLLGDVLAVSRGDLAVIWGGAAVVGALLWWRWDRILVATLGDDLARASGVDPDRERAALTLALAVVIAVGIEVVGALLIAALMVVPAAAARPWAGTPERMVAVAMGIGATAALAGLWGSWAWDVPTGPAMVCAATGAFAASAAWDRLRG
ncbi:metal ABC transporter permease [Jannaschia sp. Os4]|uniref:metal ABC transporter permease n=1 Tax=Jannaschia sp. Os4 TaxID=2807617 RepID=UPI00193A259C|nr:metal ABC transporter permease [Jannaschia sp. Os4]MBM2575882.1 metal ABC transporter permease [Jannaschia sp. Os4]